jgi:uncharacterized protein
VTTARRSVGTLLVGLLLAVLTVADASRPAEAATTYPPPSGFVVDATGILPGPVVQQVAGELASFELRTGHQMAVVLVPRLDGQSVEDYARGLFNAWGIGRAGENDGALLLIAVQERRVRVQVGPGIHDQLSDAKAVEIVNSITPILRGDDYAGGVVAGERAMRTALGDAQLEERSDGRSVSFGGGKAVERETGDQGNAVVSIVAVALLAAVALGLIVATARGAFRNKGGPGGGGLTSSAGSGGAGAAGFAGGAAGGGGGGGAAGGGGGASGGF